MSLPILEGEMRRKAEGGRAWGVFYRGKEEEVGDQVCEYGG